MAIETGNDGPVATVEVVTDDEIKRQDMALAKLEEKGIVDVDSAIEQWDAYQALCRRLLDPEKDFQKFKTKEKDLDENWVTVIKSFPKRSAFQKLGRAFNANTRIVDHTEIRTQTGRVKESEYIVEASLPKNIRVVQAMASCSRSEKGKKDASDHDIKATAETRATNRALANLIGAGEVSADEMLASNKPVKNEDKLLEEDKSSSKK